MSQWKAIVAIAVLAARSGTRPRLPTTAAIRRRSDSVSKLAARIVRR